MDKIEEMLILHESLRLKPYKCSAGKLTVGIGRNLEDKGITKSEAMMMLRNDIEDCRYRLSSIEFWSRLDVVRRAVMIDMCFNLGFDGLMKFRKFLAALDVADYATAATEMLDSKWAVQVGSRADRLSKMMRTGEWYE